MTKQKSFFAIFITIILAIGGGTIYVANKQVAQDSTQATIQADSTSQSARVEALATTPKGTRYLDTIFTKAQIDTVQETYMKGYKLVSYYVKPGIDTAKKKLCAIWLHGGGNDMNSSNSVAYCTYFAQLGYAALSIEYPCPDVFDATAQKNAVYAVWSCLQWVRSNATKGHVNPNKIYLMGSSAGAITVYQANIGSWSPNDPSFKEWLVNPNNKGLPITVVASATLSGAANGIFENLIPAMKSPNAFYTGAEDTKVPAKRQVADFNAMVASRIPFMNQPIWAQIVFPNTGHVLGNFDIISKNVTQQFYSLK